MPEQPKQAYIRIMEDNVADITADEALAEFKKEGEVEEVRRSFPEVPFLALRDEKGRFVIGTLKNYKEVVVAGSGNRVFVTLRLGKTNAKASIKTKQTDENGKKIYKSVEVKEGEDVVLAAPTRLARLLKDMVPGTEVYIEYLGKVTQTEKGKAVSFHKYDLRAKKVEKPF